VLACGGVSLGMEGSGGIDGKELESLSLVEGGASTKTEEESSAAVGAVKKVRVMSAGRRGEVGRGKEPSQKVQCSVHSDHTPIQACDLVPFGHARNTATPKPHRRRRWTWSRRPWPGGGRT
jgi:hypothetical protein